MPPHKKPMAVRELHGTAHRNKHRNTNNVPEPIKGIGPASAYLTAIEKEVWDEVVGIACPGVLGNTDRIGLEMLCKLIAEMRTDFDNMTAAKITQLSNALGRFGMTPADRMKLNVPKKKEAATGFAAL